MDLDASPDHHGGPRSGRYMVKRRVNREHNTNFNAGYINIDEQYLHRTGVRGRKAYLLYCLVVILIVLALLNILMTAGILYMLKVTTAGLEMLEFIPADSNLLRFLAGTTLPSVKVFQGGIGSRHSSSIQLDSDKQIVLNTSSFKKRDVEGFIGPNKIQFQSLDEFTLEDLESKSTLFSTKSQTWTNVENPGINLHVPSLSTAHIKSSPNVDRLVMEADRMYLTGTEGVVMTSEGEYFHANLGQHLFIQSKDGGINIEATNHMFINKNISNSSLFSPMTNITVYKVCLCMPSGRLFIVEPLSNCTANNVNDCL